MPSTSASRPSSARSKTSPPARGWSRTRLPTRTSMPFTDSRSRPDARAHPRPRERRARGPALRRPSPPHRWSSRMVPWRRRRSSSDRDSVRSRIAPGARIGVAHLALLLVREAEDAEASAGRRSHTVEQIAPGSPRRRGVVLRMIGEDRSVVRSPGAHQDARRPVLAALGHGARSSGRSSATRRPRPGPGARYGSRRTSAGEPPRGHRPRTGSCCGSAR